MDAAIQAEIVGEDPNKAAQKNMPSVSIPCQTLKQKVRAEKELSVNCENE